MDTNDKSNEEPVWAVVELMGHVRYGARVSKDTVFGTPMLRTDVPQRDGSMVTQIVNPQSIYRVTMCSEEIARAAAASNAATPMQRWELQHLLPPAQSSPVIEDGEEEDSI